MPRLIEIRTCLTREEAEMIAEMLRADGIGAEVTTSGGTGGLGSPGMLSLRVSTADAERAQALLRSLEANPLDDDEERERQERLAAVPNDTIAAGLATIRARRRRVWLLMAGVLPIYGAVLLTFGESVITGLFIASYMLAVIVAICLAGSSRCPRCGERFNTARRGGGFIGNAVTQQCLHCGLALRTASTAP